MNAIAVGWEPCWTRLSPTHAARSPHVVPSQMKAWFSEKTFAKGAKKYETRRRGNATVDFLSGW
ncbi:hypothetical protein VOM14_29750 [Paraburkholderia sp. MPAMCS5]|uniref:hypothetical protein n=1 Tax=Paraburkholderia sp. MPAMCS5 TaxID=3112563 RepID=UPI002E172636|nr:hypothetical protein [Paraburkholderia sp. MPAMCS5]